MHNVIDFIYIDVYVNLNLAFKRNKKKPKTNIYDSAFILKSVTGKRRIR